MAPLLCIHGVRPSVGRQWHYRWSTAARFRRTLHRSNDRENRWKAHACRDGVVRSARGAAAISTTARFRSWFVRSNCPHDRDPRNVPGTVGVAYPPKMRTRRSRIASTSLRWWRGPGEYIIDGALPRARVEADGYLHGLHQRGVFDPRSARATARASCRAFSRSRSSSPEMLYASHKFCRAVV